MNSFDSLIKENNRIIANLKTKHTSYLDNSYNVISHSIICLLTIENELLSGGIQTSLTGLYVTDFTKTINEYFNLAKVQFDSKPPENYFGEIGNYKKEREYAQHLQKYPD